MRTTVLRQVVSSLRLPSWLLAGVLGAACAGESQPALGGPVNAAMVGMDADPDGRISITLPAMGRHMVLSEMRLMLSSVQGYVTAAAVGDTAGMRTAASASGMAAARDMDPAMERRLPAEFLELGMATHAAWDSLASEVSRGLPGEQGLGRLGAIMDKCVACHTQFRIDLQK